MNYIVFDLEWNQSNDGAEPEVSELPFEIIDIGAIKLDQNHHKIDEFDRLVKPSVYLQMHRITGKLIHLQMKDLRKEQYFPIVMEDFRTFWGKDPIFCTWGPLDLFELQRNMRFHEMEPLAQGPIKFLDIQKLFSIAFEDGKSRRSLEYAIDFLNMEKDVPFHRAISDAYYTAKILQKLPEDVFKNYSVDTFHLPRKREEELHIDFPGYQKYISREFSDKLAAMADHEVISTKCYLCHKNLRKKIRWFTPNGKHYYSVATCPVHGLIKYKIRIKKTENDGVYIAKTSKFITEEGYQKIIKRKDEARERHKQKKKAEKTPQES